MGSFSKIVSIEEIWRLYRILKKGTHVTIVLDKFSTNFLHSTVPLTRLHRIYDNYNYIATDPDASDAVSKYGFVWNSIVGSVVPRTATAVTGYIPIYRLYKAGTTGNDDHLFTYSESEVNLAVNTVGYRYEGVRFYCASAANDFNAAIPLYRFWTGSRHFYTTNIEEGNVIVAAGGKSEGILCYIWP